MSATPIILDCDPGHDDRVAIVLAAANPAIDLRAITTVAGNASLERVTHNARATCALAGISGVPIAAGADGPLIGTLTVADHVHGASGLDGVELGGARLRALGTPLAETRAARQPAIASASPGTRPTRRWRSGSTPRASGTWSSMRSTAWAAGDGLGTRA